MSLCGGEYLPEDSGEEMPQCKGEAGGWAEEIGYCVEMKIPNKSSPAGAPVPDDTRGDVQGHTRPGLPPSARPQARQVTIIIISYTILPYISLSFHPLKERS